MNATVVGGGLAGSEAAWALAERGVRVTLHEMRPVVKTPAHQTDRLAELVCSNTFKSLELTNAHGLLKAEMRALGSLLLPCADEARVPGGSALAVDREIFSRAVHDRVTGHPQHHRGARGGDRACRRRASWRRVRSPRSAGEGDRRAAGLVGARVLRRHRADGGGRFARSRAALRASRYGKGEGDDYLNGPMDAAGLRRVHRRARRGRPASGARVRRGAVLRRLHAGRGDGAARAGDAALRADEAGGTAGPAHRPRAPRGGAAAAGGPRGTDVEPGRVPDAAPDPRAAARLPHDPGARERRVPPLRQHPPELVPQQSGQPRRRPHARRTTTVCSSPARSPASRATPNRSAPASSPASTSRAGSRAVRSPCRRRRRCSARSIATCARPTRSTSSR